MPLPRVFLASREGDGDSFELHSRGFYSETVKEASVKQVCSAVQTPACPQRTDACQTAAEEARKNIHTSTKTKA